jgi:hypothetical protein
MQFSRPTTFGPIPGLNPGILNPAMKSGLALRANPAFHGFLERSGIPLTGEAWETGFWALGLRRALALPRNAKLSDPAPAAPRPASARGPHSKSVDR